MLFSGGLMSKRRMILAQIACFPARQFEKPNFEKPG